MRRHKPDVVEHGRGVKQFGIEAQPALLSGDGAKEKDPAGVVEQQLGLGIADELCDRAAKLAIGNGHTVDGSGHFFNSFDRVYSAA